MANKSSGDLSFNQVYTLGIYQFILLRGGSASEATLTAYCSAGEDQGSKSVTIDRNKRVLSWHVEATDNVASVYAKLKAAPSSMRVTTPPTKTTYVSREALSFSGLVCTLYDADGNVFTDERYPTGQIAFPTNELQFPVYYAPDGGGGLIPCLRSEDADFTFSDGTRHYNHDPGFYYLTYKSPNPTDSSCYGKACVFGPSNRIYYTYHYKNGSAWVDIQSWDNLGYIDIGGDRYFYNCNGMGTIPNAELPAMLPEYTGDLNIAELGLALKHGGAAVTAEIPVQWPSDAVRNEIRQYYGEDLAFEDTYEITVTSS